MSASCVFRNVTLRAYNGRYLSRLCGIRRNCELCNCKTVTRSFSTRSDRYVFRFYRQVVSCYGASYLRSSSCGHMSVPKTSYNSVILCVHSCCRAGGYRTSTMTGRGPRRRVGHREILLVIYSQL